MNIILFVALESEFPANLVPQDVEVFYTGVGKVNAAIKSSMVLCMRDSKDTLVINYGSAGSKILDKNNLYKCTKFEQVDMDARPLVDKIGITPYDEELYLEIPSIISYNNTPNENEYLCSTADRFQENPSAPIVDMEAYSIAKVCKIFGFNFEAYKFISDDGNSEDWKENHHNGATKFLETLLQLMK